MSAEDDDLDGLRRRLYAPGAGQDDVARYAAATATPTEATPSQTSVTPEPGPQAPPRGRRRRTVVAWAALVAVAMAGIVVGSIAGHPMVGPTPAATSSAPTPATDQAAIPAPASVRAGLVARLDAGERAGLLDLLEADPALLPPQLRTVSRADSIEYSGEGTTTLTLSPSALAERGGRATVIIVLARSGPYRFRASRPAVGTTPAVEEQVLATVTGEASEGAPVAATFAYGRGAPRRLAVSLPAGMRWGAVVVFTD